jgi:2-oxoglutarate ferredoxin oxidoreductase subunit gamma
MELAIRLVGRGGQGIIFSGIIFAQACSKKYYVVQTQSYGAESRGGACKSDIVISSNPIYDISPGKVDILCAMSKTGLAKYINTLKNSGILIIDSLLEEHHGNFKVLSIPAREKADEIGYPIASNIIMLGFLSKLVKIDEDDISEIIKTRKFADINLRALKIGFELSKEYGQVK